MLRELGEIRLAMRKAMKDEDRDLALALLQRYLRLHEQCYPSSS